MRTITLLTLAICLLLCSCAEETQSSDLMAHIITHGTAIPTDCLIYYSDAAEHSPNRITKKTLENMYMAAYPIDSLCENYAILLGKRDIPYEIHLMKARSHSDLGELMSALNARRELLYKKENDRFNSESGEQTARTTVFCNGKYAILLLTPNNEELQKLITRYIL